MGSTVGATADMIAVCLSCGNEWVVRSPSPPGVKKKRKCPVCGKYRVRMKSELESGAGVAETPSSPPPSPPPSVPVPAAVAVPDEIRDLDLDDLDDDTVEIRGGGGSWLVAAGAVILLAGSAWFGWSLLDGRRRRRAAAAAYQGERERNAELRRYQRFPAVPGL